MEPHYYKLCIIPRYGQIILRGQKLAWDTDEDSTVFDISILDKDDFMRLGQEFIDAIESVASYQDG